MLNKGGLWHMAMKYDSTNIPGLLLLLDIKLKLNNN